MFVEHRMNHSFPEQVPHLGFRADIVIVSSYLLVDCIAFTRVTLGSSKLPLEF